MGTDPVRGFVIPGVVYVSVQHYTKLMQLYSTVRIKSNLDLDVFGSCLPFRNNLFFQVVILNATSISVELRFDIPLGVSPKVI